MLKLVLFGALLALAAAAPQFPFYPGYHPYPFYNFSPFPYVRSPLEVPLPFSQPYLPYSIPYMPSYYPSVQQQEQDQPQAPAPVQAPAPEKPKPQPAKPHYADDEIVDIENVKVYLTPEQQVLFEAAVAAMNPLEYAAHLDSLTNPSPKVSQEQTTQAPQVLPGSVPIRSSAPPNEGIEVSVVTPLPSRIRPHLANKGELSIDEAKVYLTPEQRVLFEAAVASADPLEYAARLDSLRNPDVAKKTRL